ncbi:MAG TPA: aminotransferase class V-fold PLP-dependent enzyme [Bacteriovoracaceae bacterium]|nr:aminotransferase class V-fold PLP-dependent enzyme [Bacteriovoracaceae bacterium]
MFENFKVPSELIPSDPRFGVGPSLIPVEAVENLLKTGKTLLGTSHRKTAVRNVVKELQDGLRDYFKLPPGHEIVLGNGGATLFWDMMGLGLVRHSSLHYVCGEFSDKWYRSSSSIPWIKAKAVKVDFGEGINPREEEGFDFICSTLNETSTGVMLTEIPKLKNPDTLIAVDATSGAGQIKIDFNKTDVYYFSPQKVFASEGGFYVAIMSPKAIARAMEISADTKRFIPEALKLTHALENSRQNQTYNTPAISTIFFMNEQVKLMNKLGEDQVIAQAKEKASLIYGWAEEKSYLSPFVKTASFRSHAVATIDVDPQFNADDLALVLRKQGVAFDIESYRKLGRNQFRISLFHNISFADLKKLTQIISRAFETHTD